MVRDDAFDESAGSGAGAGVAAGAGGRGGESGALARNATRDEGRYLGRGRPFLDTQMMRCHAMQNSLGVSFPSVSLSARSQICLSASMLKPDLRNSSTASAPTT